MDSQSPQESYDAKEYRRDALVEANDEETSGSMDTPAEVWQQFLDETSLLGIQRTFQKKSFLWMMASILCLAMGILQSWRTAQEYFGNKSLQRLLVTNKSRLPFPSVTVCSNVLLPADFNLSLISGYNTSVHEIKPENCDSEAEQEQWEKVMEKNDQLLIEYLRQLPTKVRMNYSVPIDHFLLSCKLGGKLCDRKSEKTFDVFNNPVFGNCFTVNPAFQGRGYEADVSDRLKLELKTDSSGYRIHSDNLHLPLLIHAPGSPPILTSPAVHDLYSGTHVSFAMKMTEKLFVAYPSAEKKPCIEKTNEKYRRRSIFYSDNSPYMYSLEACMATCEQKYYKKLCGVIDATFPIQPQEYEDRVKTALPPVKCRSVPDLDLNLCDCPIPCRLLQYSYVPDTTENPVPDCEKKEQADDHDGGNPEDLPVELKHFHHHNSKVSIFFASNIYETTAEELEHSLSQFLGILGGNISLWVGICVLSLLEVVDLVISLLVASFRQRKMVTPQREAQRVKAEGSTYSTCIQPDASIDDHPQGLRTVRGSNTTFVYT